MIIERNEISIDLSYDPFDEEPEIGQIQVAWDGGSVVLFARNKQIIGIDAWGHSGTGTFDRREWMRKVNRHYDWMKIK